MFHRSKAKRLKLREKYWPNSGHWKWPPPKKEGGWAKVPRSVGTLLCALTENSKGKDLSRTYLDLLARAPPEGLIEIRDEKEHALLSGFTPNERGVRSWKERLERLAELGFVRLVESPTKAAEFVVVVHPREAMKALFEAKQLTPPIWNLFERITTETGAANGDDDEGEEQDEDD